MQNSHETIPTAYDVTAEQFRAAMASFATGVTVVTTLDDSDYPSALTATAFTSVSMAPPRCLVCVHKRARPSRSLLTRASFAINILGAEHKELSERFAAPLADRFAGVLWSPGERTGCPIIDGALAWMECDIAEVYASGDHDIIVGDLRSIHVRDGMPLVYFRGSCSTLLPPSATATTGPAEASAKTTVAPTSRRSTKHGQIPEEFLPYIVDQEHAANTLEQHEVWREVLSRNEQVLDEYSRYVHPAYTAGMEQLELPRRIPRLEEINERLAPTGWRTVCVDGYVPSAVYAGLMALRIFPISRQIRRKEHIDFAPAPDMVHDVLGHLAMLYYPEHREFLRRLSDVMSKARPNQLDSDFYADSVRMAELKWDPASSPDEISIAEERVASVHRALVNNASELTQLRRMYVWSVEFGLIGSKDDFAVFGAAFFSSPTEFRAVCERKAPLLPYSMDVIHYENAFSDLLTQYFVTPDFALLESVLERYESRMGIQTQPPRTSEIRGIRTVSSKTRRQNA